MVTRGHLRLVRSNSHPDPISDLEHDCPVGCVKSAHNVGAAVHCNGCRSVFTPANCPATGARCWYRTPMPEVGSGPAVYVLEAAS